MKIKFLCTVIFLFVLQTYVLHAASPERKSKLLSGLPVATIPFETISNLIFVQLQVNGAKPVWFILDSGASGWVLDEKYAAQLGLKTEGKEQRGGAGAGRFDVTFSHNVTYSVPAAFTTTVERTIVLDFQGLQSKLGHDFSGLLGYEFFRDFVVAIHYDSGVVRLYEPGTFEYTGRGEVVPLTIKKNHPHIMMGLKVKGGETQQKEIMIDTGSADSIDNDLIAQSASPRLTAIGGIGLGEEFRIELGHYESVQLGRLTFRNVAGATGASMMGGEFLHRFTVIFDYTKGQVVFEPNRHLEDEYLFNASGIDVERVEDGIRITGLLKDFPAERAGFQQGDVITAIDGQPVSNFRLQHIIQILHEGGQYWFTTTRKGETATRKLLIPAAGSSTW